MPVFRSSDSGVVAKLEPHEFANEKALQTWFEQNLEAVLGVRFVATEFSTGEKHGGRIDTLGLDEAGNPVIIEYKWDKSESVINQGLFYLDWLMDHRGDFMIAVQKALGADVEVIWAEPRLIIVAGSYTKYDTYAVNQLPRSIELLRYQRYEDDVVVVEAVSDSLTTKATAAKAGGGSAPERQAEPQEYGLAFHLSKTRRSGTRGVPHYPGPPPRTRWCGGAGKPEEPDHLPHDPQLLCLRLSSEAHPGDVQGSRALAGWP